MDLSKSDLLKLVSMLEGELQAREIVIAVMKSEQIKLLLNPSKSSSPMISGFRSTKQIDRCQTKSTEFSADQTVKYATDPLVALSRDSFAVYEPSLDYQTSLALNNIKIFQLENLINEQIKYRQKINERLKFLETRQEDLLKELDLECSKNKLNEVNDHNLDKVLALEEKISSLTQTLTETKENEKKMIMMLLDERKHLILKLIEEKHHSEELIVDLNSEKGKIAEMVEGLEDESKRSLRMEAELEKYISDFEKERNDFKSKLQQTELKNSELLTEMERLKLTIENLQNQLSYRCKEEIDSNKSWNIGEGVRSSIVTTMPIGPKVQSFSQVNPVFHPKANVAQPITKTASVAGSTSKNIQDTNTNIILPPPSIPVPQPKPCQQSKISNVTDNQNTSTILSTQKTAINSNSMMSTTSTVAISQPPIDHSVKQTVKFYEKSANQIKSNISSSITPSSSTINSTSTMKKPIVGPRPTPPPIPPNKPSIKPILPPQAVVSSSKLSSSTTLNNNKDSSQRPNNCNNTQTKVLNHHVIHAQINSGSKKL